MTEFIKDASIACVVIIILIFGLQGCDRFSCWRLSKDTQLETKFTIFSGCLIKTDKGYIPKKQWRAF